jgi:hypothetical protein
MGLGFSRWGETVLVSGGVGGGSDKDLDRVMMGCRRVGVVGVVVAVVASSGV